MYAQKLSGGSFMEWVSMAEQLHASLPSPSPMPSVGWSGVKHTDTGLWSSGNVFCGVTNHASLFGSQMGESGFGGCRENVTCLTALCHLWREGGRYNGMGLFFRVWTRPF